MYSGSAIPRVESGSSMTTAVKEMEKFRLGAVLILDKNNTLKGIITDGDIRHLIAEKTPFTGCDFDSFTVEHVMTFDPHVILPDLPLYDALNIMEKHQITILPVTDSEKHLLGILHLHDILGKGTLKFTDHKS